VSDPIFMRNMLSSSVYAEQMNSAQIQGQHAASERAARLRQEKFLQEQASIQQAVEANKTGVKERDGRQPGSEQEMSGDDDTVDRDEATGTEAGAATDEGAHHIDLTV